MPAIKFHSDPWNSHPRRVQTVPQTYIQILYTPMATPIALFGSENLLETYSRSTFVTWKRVSFYFCKDRKRKAILTCYVDKELN